MTPELYNSRFMRAVRREPCDTTPVWLMRQAGRYLPEYMSVRSKVAFKDLCKTPALAAEVTLTAQRRLNVDAAILFADLLPMLEPMGIDLEYAQGEGPVIHNPVREPGDVDRIHALENLDALDFVFEAVRLIRRSLDADIPLLGFAGAPFTLASYVIEGGSSRNYVTTKSLMYNDRGAWHALMQSLVSSLVLYLRAQLEAGCQAVQVFDSWAGCLSPSDYREFVLPYSQQVFRGLPADAATIHFITGNPSLLPLASEAGGQVIGLDWRVGLNEGWALAGSDKAVQGNLDPVLLFSDLATLKRRTQDIFNEVAGRPGHIFNLGHGVLPETDHEKAIALVEMVHEMGARR